MDQGFVQLRSFLAVAEHGSITRAAGSLNYSQPAVSLQLRALERQVGQVLFERHAGGAVLTAEGLRLLPVAQEILHLAKAMFPQQDGQLAEVIVLGAAGGTRSSLAPPEPRG